MWGPNLQLEINLPYLARVWLNKDKVPSITKSIKGLCKRLGKEFSVHLIDQRPDSPYKDEQLLLGINEDDKSFIRQVHLNVDDVPWSYGRVIVPQATYLHFKEPFDNLGTQSIGEALLHSNPNTIREPMEYAHIKVGSDLFNLAVAGLEIPIEQDLWARRSIFSIDGYKLLVVEVLLPEILAHNPLVKCSQPINQPKPRL